MSALDVRWLGRIDYQRALELQEEIVRAHASTGDVLLLLEHDPVYTTGRGGRAEHLPGTDGRAPAPEVPVVRIGRGGDATYHGPGQLVGYALVDLRARGGDVHRFLRDLEGGVIAVLAAYGVAGARVPGRTGVWVSGRRRNADAAAEIHQRSLPAGGVRKIASIGIGVRRGISMHGFALNVSVDLTAFASIVPCGIADAEMTSMAAEGLEPLPALEEVAATAARLVPAALARPRESRDPAEAAR